MSDKNKSAGEEIKFQISESQAVRKYEKVNELIKLCTNNGEFYKQDKTITGSRMTAAFEKLHDYLNKAVPVTRNIDSFAHTYDYDESTPGNGFRSFIFIFEAALDYSLKTCQYINDNRGSLLFRKSVYLKYLTFLVNEFFMELSNFFISNREIDVCEQMIESLTQILENLVQMHENSDNGNLYSKEYSHDNQITRAASVINQICFYGRSIGFQYADSLKSLLRYITVACASFSESYYMKGALALKTTSYFLKQPSYFMDPELCARRIINVSRNCDVKFCKVSKKVP